MKKIIYATDFSQASRESFTYALQSARTFGAELVVVHVYQIPDTYKFPYTSETIAFEKKEIAESKKKLQKIFDSYFYTEVKDVDIRYRVVRDASVYRGIIEAVEEEFPAVLMLSAVGDNVSQEDLFGGVVQRLIKNTIIPVLTIPTGVSTPKFEKMLFTTNLYESELIALKQLIELFGSTKPEITIVHVRDLVDSREASKTQVFWKLVKDNIDYDQFNFQELFADNIFEVLNNYIRTHDYDLLTMTNKEHGGAFYRLLHNDLIKAVEVHSTIPVLSFNDEGLEIIKLRDINLQAFKESLDHDLEEIKRLEEEKVLTAISRITKDIETNYPELYSSLEEEPITLPTEKNPNIDQSAMSDYLDSLRMKLEQYKANQDKGNKGLFRKVYK